MSTFSRRFPYLLNALVIAVTIVFVAVALVVGRAQGADPILLDVGDPSPATFVATRDVRVPDTIATDRERETARQNTPVEYTIDATRKTSVKGDIARFFAEIRNVAFEDVPPPDPDTSPDPIPTTTTTTTTTTTLPPG